MAGRASVFSHPEVIRLLDRFVPVAVDARLTRRLGDVFFDAVVEQGHYTGRTAPTDTRQGFYACTADGRLLAALNSRRHAEVIAALQRALHLYDAGLDRAESIAPALEQTTTGWTYPSDSLVLKVWARDLPRTSGPARPEWNLDHAWLSRAEARSLMPVDRRPGATYAVRPEVVRRLARFHLLDFVRGVTPRWNAEHVRHARLRGTVVRAGKEFVDVVFSGRAWIEAPASGAVNPFNGCTVDRPRGVDLQLAGEARIRRRDDEIERFDLVAVGSRWGASMYNRRFDDPGPAPIGIAFALASPSPLDRIPPALPPEKYFAAW